MFSQWAAVGSLIFKSGCSTVVSFNLIQVHLLSERSGDWIVNSRRAGSLEMRICVLHAFTSSGKKQIVFVIEKQIYSRLFFGWVKETFTGTLENLLDV